MKKMYSQVLLGFYQNVREVLKCQMSVRFLKFTAKKIPEFPHLPVPDLKQTVEKYLKSVEPFLSPENMEKTKELAKKFEQKEAPLLQRILLEKAKYSENWLTEWWTDVAFLANRDSVVSKSSPGLIFPRFKYTNDSEKIEIVAKVILGTLNHKFLIDNDLIPADKMGKFILDMSQYKRVMGMCRVPGPKKDYLEHSPTSRHITIVRNNHFFKLDVLNSALEPPSVKQLVDQLNEITEKSGQPGPPIGILTADQRDHWARNYKILMTDKSNQKRVKEIQKSLFLVCLDNPMPNISQDVWVTASHQALHGGGSKFNTANRWFDKTVQIIFGSDGIVTLNFEHAPSEGQPIANLVDYMMKFIDGRRIKEMTDTTRENGPEYLKFHVSTVLQQGLDKATKAADAAVDVLDISQMKVKIGKKQIKKFKLSPDSFIQNAIQLAYYRVHGGPGYQTEKANTRKFIHGRSEIIRSCTSETVAFCKAMEGGSSNEEKLRLMKDAIDAHKRYATDASNGFGVDRHLLGLLMAAKENNLEIPKFFSDASYILSTHSVINASQIGATADLVLVFAPSHADGYGIGYNPRREDTNFTISIYKGAENRDCGKMKEAIEKSMQDMFQLLGDSKKGEEPPKK